MGRRSERNTNWQRWCSLMAKRVATDEPGTDVQRGNPQQRGWVWTNSSRGRGSGWLIFTDESGEVPVCRWCLYEILCACMLSCSVVSDSYDPMDSSPSDSVHGIFQARILEWVSIFFFRGSIHPKDLTHVTWISCIAGGFFYPLSQWGSL